MSQVVPIDTSARLHSGPPPSNPEAERAVLGALILQGCAYDVAARLLSAVDFFEDRNQRIFRALGRLAERRQPLDLVVLKEELARAGDLEHAGGLAYVARLVDGVPKSVNVTHYAQVVKKRAIERRLMYLCQKAGATLRDSPDRSDDAIFELERGLIEAKIAQRGGSSVRDFHAVGESRYVFNVLDQGIQFDIDRLRRERNELIGELSVRCDLAGAKTFDGTLSIADFNLSSARARQERAKLLTERSKAQEIDWLGLLEELCQRVLASERLGQPAVTLRDLQKPEPAEEFEITGVRLLKRHPAIIFGDGGDAKSLTALYLLGELARRGVRVLYSDWEFSGEEHRDRLAGC